jgi:hypothetical protein
MTYRDELALNWLLEITSELSIFELFLILLLLLLNVELVPIGLIGIGLLGRGLSVARIFSSHHCRVVTHLLLHESTRIPNFLLKLLLGYSVLVQLLLSKHLSRHVGIRDSGGHDWRLVFSPILVLLSEVDPRIVPLVHFLFLFNSLGVPSARSQSLLQGLLLQDPVVHEVEVEALSHE